MTKGTVIGGKYRLVRLLGTGTMGEVWAAVNESTGGEVALKLLRQEGDDFRRRLLREARACGKLRHRNVVAVHDVGETDERAPFLVMQLLTGETLAELLHRTRRLSQQRAAQIARDVARALSAAHRAGIVHRDLKPANIFLHAEEGGEDVVVKVLDFSVSKNNGSMTIAGSAVGSPAYMSPEQAGADPGLDHRTDLWSLGVVLFEMLAGKRPFDGDTQQIIAKQIALGTIPLVSEFVRNISPGLRDVVSRCLERDVARRFGSAEELGAALDRFAQSTTAAPPEALRGAPAPIGQPPAEMVPAIEAPPMIGGGTEPLSPGILPTPAAVARPVAGTTVPPAPVTAPPVAPSVTPSGAQAIARVARPSRRTAFKGILAASTVAVVVAGGASRWLATRSGAEPHDRRPSDETAATGAPETAATGAPETAATGTVPETAATAVPETAVPAATGTATETAATTGRAATGTARAGRTAPGMGREVPGAGAGTAGRAALSTSKDWRKDLFRPKKP